MRSIGCRVEGNQLNNLAGGIELYGPARYAEIVGNSVAGFVPSTISGVGVWGRAAGGQAATFCRVEGNRVYGAPRMGLLWDAGSGYGLSGNLAVDCPDSA